MQSARGVVVAISSALLVLASACSYDDAPVSATAKMDAVPDDCATIKGWPFVRDTLLTKCSGSACHDPGNASAIVVLTPTTALQNTVGVVSRALPAMKLVEPGRPSRSFFFRKLSSTQEAACASESVTTSQCGAQMPLNDWFSLPDAWIEDTRAWIACGAKP